jgi:hypothetical protein
MLLGYPGRPAGSGEPGFGPAARTGLRAERPVVSGGVVKMKALVCFAFTGDYRAFGAELLFEDGYLVSRPQQISIETGYGSDAGAGKDDERFWNSDIGS